MNKYMDFGVKWRTPRRRSTMFEKILMAIVIVILAAAVMLFIHAIAIGDTINTRNLIVACDLYDTGGLDYMDVSIQCEGGDWTGAERTSLTGALEAHIETPFTISEDANVKARMTGCDLGGNCVSAESEWYTVDTQGPTCFITINGAM